VTDEEDGGMMNRNESYLSKKLVLSVNILDVENVELKNVLYKNVQLTCP